MAKLGYYLIYTSEMLWLQMCRQNTNHRAFSLSPCEGRLTGCLVVLYLRELSNLQQLGALAERPTVPARAGWVHLAGLSAAGGGGRQCAARQKHYAAPHHSAIGPHGAAVGARLRLVYTGPAGTVQRQGLLEVRVAGPQSRRRTQTQLRRA